MDHSNPAMAHDKDINITLVGEHLSTTLENKGFSVLFENTDFAEITKKNNLPYTESYQASRNSIENALTNYKSIKMVLDIHRDVQPRNVTTTKIDGEEVAKILFVISDKHTNYEENEQFAKDIHERLEEKYPGLSRGVYVPNGSNIDKSQNYNQELFGQSLIVEIGGIENTLEEVYRSSNYFA